MVNSTAFCWPAEKVEKTMFFLGIFIVAFERINFLRFEKQLASAIDGELFARASKI